MRRSRLSSAQCTGRAQSAHTRGRKGFGPKPPGPAHVQCPTLMCRLSFHQRRRPDSRGLCSTFSEIFGVMVAHLDKMLAGEKNLFPTSLSGK